MRGGRRRWVGLVLCVALSGAAAVTMASPAPDTAAAYRHLQAGYDRYQAGQYAEAIVEFERAYALSPEPRFLLNIAVSLNAQGGRCPAALAAFERFATVCADCAERDDGRARWAEVRAACEASIEVVVPVLGAYITIDGRPKGLAPYAGRLVEGPHIIGATWPDGRATERSVMVAGGETRRIEIAPPTPPAVTADSAWPAWTALGVGAAGVGAAAVFGGLLLADLDAEKSAVGRENVMAVRADAEDNAIASQVALGAGLIGLAVAWWLWPDDGATPGENAGLLIGPGAVFGRW